MQFPYLTGKGLIAFSVAYFIIPSSSPWVLSRLGARQLEHFPSHHPSPWQGCHSQQKPGLHCWLCPPTRKTRAQINTTVGFIRSFNDKRKDRTDSSPRRCILIGGNPEDVGFTATQTESNGNLLLNDVISQGRHWSSVAVPGARGEQIWGYLITMRPPKQSPI